jgi:hypothetical protein
MSPYVGTSLVSDLDREGNLVFVLGTVANETGDFRVRTENLTFFSAERIRTLWPNRFPTVADAEPFVDHPEQLAEKVYGDRFGNTHPGDTWRYRSDRCDSRDRAAYRRGKSTRPEVSPRSNKLGPIGRWIESSSRAG